MLGFSSMVMVGKYFLSTRWLFLSEWDSVAPGRPRWVCEAGYYRDHHSRGGGGCSMPLPSLLTASQPCGPSAWMGCENNGCGDISRARAVAERAAAVVGRRAAASRARCPQAALLGSDRSARGFVSRCFLSLSAGSCPDYDLVDCNVMIFSKIP